MSVLTMTRGDRATFDITLTDKDGDPLDLTDVHLTFTARRAVWTGAYDSDNVWGVTKSVETIEKTEVDGIEVNADPKTGLATLTLDPADTEDFTDDVITGPFDWDVEVRTDAGDVGTPLAGVLVIRPDITLPVTS